MEHSRNRHARRSPTVGDAYRQEYYEGEAEDMGGSSTSERLVPSGSANTTDVVITTDWNPLEPEVDREQVLCTRSRRHPRGPMSPAATPSSSSSSHRPADPAVSESGWVQLRLRTMEPQFDHTLEESDEACNQARIRRRPRRWRRRRSRTHGGQCLVGRRRTRRRRSRHRHLRRRLATSERGSSRPHRTRAGSPARRSTTRRASTRSKSRSTTATRSTCSSTSSSASSATRTTAAATTTDCRWRRHHRCRSGWVPQPASQRVAVGTVTAHDRWWCRSSTWGRSSSEVARQDAPGSDEATRSFDDARLGGEETDQHENLGGSSGQRARTNHVKP